ncbi:hypothetical protein [Jeotgalibacillus haloalkalitolerans]|uniref:DUF4365 domain-containing protein n=1 Tax=Jeotgalibacillus haloalkalitolerans TaxID=3104292 RepID=A0ABU5KQY2_9BACL|nr:hypothetical protein [Jeotgalibacillus sp. HH7-29]MDZ5713552.1 hypothetical protein [Jeotgalibacillus sp. HH7-29]
MDPQTEDIAVDAITKACRKPKSRVKANVLSGDKTVSFDGEIELYSSPAQTVKDLISKVPVQVKGITVDTFSGSTRTYPIRMDDIKNYYAAQGVVYFVVEMLVNEEADDYDTRIYYRQFFSQELKQLIDNYGSQQSRSVTFFTLEGSTIERVCRTFVDEREKQPTVTVKNEALKRDFTFEYYEAVTTTLLPHSKQPEEVFEHNFTIYGVTKEKFPVPIITSQPASFKYGSKRLLKINDHEYHFYIEEERLANGAINISIEDVLFIEVYKGNKYHVEIKNFHSIKLNLMLLSLVKDLLNGHELMLTSVLIKIDNVTDKDEALEQITKEEQILTAAQSIFAEKGISDEIKFHDDYHAILSELAVIVKNITEGSCVGFETNKNNGYVLHTLANKGYLFFVLNGQSEKETYLIDPFSEEFSDIKILVSNEKRTERVEMCNYYLLDAKALTKSINIDLDQIYSAIDSGEANDRIELANDFCLQCIKAYDISKNKDHLALAEYIYKKYDEVKEPSMKQVVGLNLIQIEWRINQYELSDSLIDQLIQMKIQAATDQHILLYCINVLLDNKIEAGYHFSKLTLDDQKNLKNLPIWRAKEILESRLN